ncbi:hypothetical protein TSOC_006524 [Tetrabaena socialis]|uniref:Uncharacterized protein n=1 Tax=Tetrabaena socialis TaxID=47790 RepID=A0A2J8A3C3_9CHLO|nr:hypothetical protein TSOC_006524 [Tetrabaena socialis]|eukprot:PNH07022.1 hypothetical protein TSOC_006524 [Tetrabaena socialis]
MYGRATYDVEVEPAPKAPNSAPRFGGSPPLPPPPPPPGPTSRLPKAPSRREMLFAALGLGLGVAGTYTYDNPRLDPEELDARLTGLLDELMDDEALLNVLGEEIMLRKDLKNQEEAVTMLEGLRDIDEQLNQALENLKGVDAAKK